MPGHAVVPAGIVPVEVVQLEVVALIEKLDGNVIAIFASVPAPELDGVAQTNPTRADEVLSLSREIEAEEKVVASAERITKAEKIIQSRVIFFMAFIS